MKSLDNIKDNIKSFVSKLSRGLMLPIALLPIAGLFLGIGSGFENVMNHIGQSHGWSDSKIEEYAYAFTIIKMIGDVVFHNLPILFTLGIAIAFADDAGVAVFSAFVGWIIFNITQSVFIIDGPKDDLGNIISYTIGPWKNVPASVVDTNVGIKSMQTSVFGGIVIGFFVAFLYNKFHTFQMPKILGFFSGTRFVPILTFLAVPLIGGAFVCVWPIIGIGLEKFGKLLGESPTGVDSFAFGVIERSLIPFGLHHAFYTPLWYTSVGGTLTAGANIDVINNSIQPGEIAAGNQNIWFAMQSWNIPFSVLSPSFDISAPSGWELVNDTNITYNGQDIATITKGINPGSYMQGKFPLMLFGLPAAGLAMIMAAKKENRQLAISIIGSSALTSFLTGITEPIEFTFLFLAPYLYYGFHIWMAGVSFMSLDLLGSHVGMTFSGGIFDYVLFGILPDSTGQGVNSFWIPTLGVAYAIIYYIVFYFLIIKFNIQTPGRASSDQVKMFTKADYKDKKVKKRNKNNDRKERVLELEEKLGGLDNLTSIDACITRLRITVKDRSKLDDKGLISMGAKGVVGKGKSVQVIFGAEADKFKTELKDLKKERKLN